MPDLYLQDSSNLRDIADIRYQDGGTLRTITDAWMQDGANLRKVWPAQSQPPYTPMSGYVTMPNGSGTGTGIKTVGTARAFINDGSPPYSYSWSVSGTGFYVSGSGQNVSIKQTNQAASSYFGTVSCTITDGTGSITRTDGFSFQRNAVYVPMSGDISPNSISGAVTHGFTQFVDIDTATISVNDGDAPYSYQWSLSDSAPPMALGNASSATVTVRISKSGPVGTYTPTLTCVVTDGQNNTLTKSIPTSVTIEAPTQPLTGTLPDISATKTATAHQIPNPSPPPPYFTAYSWDGGTIGTSTANVSGGDGTYSYQWSITGQAWDVSGSGATATVSSAFGAPRGTYTETLTCVVSDGQQSITLTSTVTLEVV